MIRDLAHFLAQNMLVDGDCWGDRRVTKGHLGELILSLNDRDELGLCTISLNFCLLINVIEI